MTNRNPSSWRGRVQEWLAVVLQHRHAFGYDLRSAAIQVQSQFPKNSLVTVMAQVYRDLAVWFVKSAIREAATSMGVTLDDTELDFLADLAVMAVLPVA